MLTESEAWKILHDYIQPPSNVLERADWVAGLGLAAAAIATRLSEGVVWEGKANNREGWPWIDSNEARRSLREAVEKVEDGQLVKVVFRIVEGTEDES